MRLRVVGYGAPAVAAYPDRPTIIVEGEMGGQDFEGHPDDTPDDIRRVHGTVSMLSTGHVRWRLVGNQSLLPLPSLKRCLDKLVEEKPQR